MKQELIPAPIDNKNVMTDFTEVFHNGDCLRISSPVGNKGDTQFYEYFVVENCLCCVNYCFGRNKFVAYIQHFSTGYDYEKAERYIQQCVEQLYHDNVTQELIVKKTANRVLGHVTCEFYFKEK